jgi:hypothetical protein
MSLEIGQKVQIDLLGMRMRGLCPGQSQAEGTVVQLQPGVITVRLRRGDGGVADVTVGPGRIERA